MTIAEIGNLIKQRRELLKITQADLSEMSGIAIKTIHQIENGTGNPSLATLSKLLNVVGLDITIDLKRID